MSERSERLFGEKPEGQLANRMRPEEIQPGAPLSWDEFLARLAAEFPDQRDAPPSFSCVLEDGENVPHTTFTWHLTRGRESDDFAALWTSLHTWLSARTGPIYWRLRPSLNASNIRCRVTRSAGTFFDTKPGLAVDPT